MQLEIAEWPWDDGVALHFRYRATLDGGWTAVAGYRRPTRRDAMSEIPKRAELLDGQARRGRVLTARLPHLRRAGGSGVHDGRSAAGRSPFLAFAMAARIPAG